MFVRHFGKFSPGDFLYHRSKKRIAIIGDRGDLKTIHLQWLSGKDELLRIHPANAKQSKYLKKIKNSSKYSLADFTFTLGLSTGVLMGKIKKVTTLDDTGEVVGFCFLLDPSRKLIDSNFPNEILREVQRSLNLDGEYQFSISTKCRGDVTEWLVRFQR